MNAKTLKDKLVRGDTVYGTMIQHATNPGIVDLIPPNTLFVPMIESVQAVENLDAICSIPGVNALFVGPNDLTTNMGIPNEYDHPDLIKMMQRIIDIGNRHHIAAGSWFGKPEQQLRTMKQGARFVVYSNESAMMRDAMAEAFAKLRKG
jgi:2-keto-3-deoxy-L-rhamnonate aldolase RhmA